MLPPKDATERINPERDLARETPTARGVGIVPLVDVTYDDTVAEGALRNLAELLLELVPEAVDCPEEPWVGPVQLGDLEIRFRPKGPFDAGGLNCVIEVRTKLFPSRERDKQRRADLIRDRISAQIELGAFGVWLVLAEGAWSQSPSA